MLNLNLCGIQMLCSNDIQVLVKTNDDLPLPQQGQNMTHPLVLGQCIIYKDETKVLIACDNTQDINVQHQG